MTDAVNDSELKKPVNASDRCGTVLRLAVWLMRIFTGGVFIVSGWAKAVDPSGFIIKVGEYLAVWGWTVPHEVIVAGCISLSALEFGTGVMVATGCFKRMSVWCAAAMMAFMMPLTLYIAIADPVAGCGCFGDLLVISNWGTFAKNVIISLIIVGLVIYNRRVSGLYPSAIQWLVATVVVAFPLTLSFIGYHVQPVVDFRPYKNGTVLFHPETEEGEEVYVYEHNGRRAEFSLDSLPGEEWTFVEVRGVSEDVADMAVRNEDDEDVSEEIVSDSEPQVWLILPDPGLQFLTRAHYVIDMHHYLQEHGIDFTALVGSRGDGFRYWEDLIHPRFPVYSAEDTALEQLARGNAAVVYTKGGRIVWKRTLSSLPDELFSAEVAEEGGNVFDTVKPVDDGFLAKGMGAIFVGALIVLYLLGLSPRLLRLISAR